MPTKILVADDSATMRSVLEMTFAGEDAQVVSVESGDACVTKAAEVQPDVIFADASLEGVDGYEIAKRVKSNPALAQTAVIVMASQHNPFDDGKGRSCGVDDHISKPFDTQSVIDRMAQVMGRPRASASAGASVPPAAAAAAPAAAAAAAPPTAPPAVPAAARAAPPAAPAAPAHATRAGLGGPPPTPPAAATRPAPPAAKPSAPARSSAIPTPAAAARTAPPAGRPSAPAAVASAAANGMASKLDGLGLTKEQIDGVMALSREVVEQVVWEVVPDLAEALIKEEIKRLTAD